MNNTFVVISFFKLSLLTLIMFIGYIIIKNRSLRIFKNRIAARLIIGIALVIFAYAGTRQIAKEEGRAAAIRYYSHKTINYTK